MSKKVEKKQKNKSKNQEEKDKGITVKRDKDMPEWYSQVILKSGLADFAPVKGCYIIKPLGYAIWQSIQDYFNQRLKLQNVDNAYFPLFIPESFFHREAEHAKGFSPEVAWIANKDEDQERLAVRPTSETIMYDSYAKWIRSHRDLPLKINQWANVVRWETQATKLFLRSREFLWQEGHCVYETLEECDKETLLYLAEYKKLCEELLAVPVIMGKKTDKEKFAGAYYTTTIESLMPDGKALQCGTSHNLGQGFAKSFGISFIGDDEKEHLPWQNSWGFSTRLIGAMVMTHSDDKGLVLPPKVAKNKLVIIPILFDKTKKQVLKKCKELLEELSEFDPVLDDREEYSPGWKYNEYELKGMPLRLEVGPRDLEAGHAMVVRRDTGEKETVKFDKLLTKIPALLDNMQKDLLKKAEERMYSNIVETESWDEFAEAIKNQKMVKTNFCGETSCEDWIKDKSGGASSRCIPLGDEKPKQGSKCIYCGKPAKVNIYFARSY